MTDDIVLHVRDLCTYFYTFEGVVKAVDGIEFCIHKGETLGLVGESGCGKSVTALSILQLIPQPPGRIMDGQVLFEGQNLMDLSTKQMQRIRGNCISMIFQDPMTSLNPVFSIGDQIAESIRLHQKSSRREAMKRAVEMLEEVVIPDSQECIKRYPHELSGGMRQRVMIAIALSSKPKILIADEPSTALDVTIQAQILDLINKLKRDFNTSVLLITHDLGVIAETAQFVTVMYTGKIVEFSDVIELFTHPRHPYTRGLMDSIPKNTSLAKGKMLPTIPGVVPSPINLPSACSFRARCSQVFDQCRKEVPPFFDLGSNH